MFEFDGAARRAALRAMTMLGIVFVLVGVLTPQQAARRRDGDVLGVLPYVFARAAEGAPRG